jgi:hypothetical protein
MPLIIRSKLSGRGITDLENRPKFPANRLAAFLPVFIPVFFFQGIPFLLGLFLG